MDASSPRVIGTTSWSVGGVDRRDDPQVALGRVAQHAQCLLVAGGVVGRHGGLHAVELDQGRPAGVPPSKVCAGSPRARNRPPAARIAGPARAAYAATRSGSEMRVKKLIQ